MVTASIVILYLFLVNHCMVHGHKNAYKICMGQCLRSKNMEMEKCEPLARCLRIIPYWKTTEVKGLRRHSSVVCVLRVLRA